MPPCFWRHFVKHYGHEVGVAEGFSVGHLVVFLLHYWGISGCLQPHFNLGRLHLLLYLHLLHFTTRLLHFLHLPNSLLHLSFTLHPGSVLHGSETDWFRSLDEVDGGEIVHQGELLLAGEGGGDEAAVHQVAGQQAARQQGAGHQQVRAVSSTGSRLGGLGGLVGLVSLGGLMGLVSLVSLGGLRGLGGLVLEPPLHLQQASELGAHPHPAAGLGGSQL